MFTRIVYNNNNPNRTDKVLVVFPSKTSIEFKNPEEASEKLKIICNKNISPKAIYDCCEQKNNKYEIAFRWKDDVFYGKRDTVIDCKYADFVGSSRNGFLEKLYDFTQLNFYCNGQRPVLEHTYIYDNDIRKILVESKIDTDYDRALGFQLFRLFGNNRIIFQKGDKQKVINNIK